MRTRSYTELTPSETRYPTVRAPRSRPQQLFPQVPWRWLVDDRESRLHNLSDSGARFVPAAQSLRPGDTVPVRLELDGRAVVDCQGEVVRLHEGRHPSAAVRFKGGHVSVADLSRLHDELAIRRAVQQEGLATEAIPQAYRDAIGEFSHFLLWHRHVLRAGTESEPLDDELLQGIAETVGPRFRAHCARAEEALAVAPADPALQAKLREFTAVHITSLLREAPVVARGYDKPLGYPGDFELMEMIYEPRLEGETAFGRLFHHLVLQDPLAEGGRARCEHMTATLEREYKRWLERGGAGRFRVVSLGCGPARELQQWLGTLRGQYAIDVVLIDQELSALELARQGCQSAAGPGVDVRVTCQYRSFVEMVRSPELLQVAGPPDLVFVTGVFDYLTADLAKQVVASLTSSVPAGGSVVVANARAPKEHTWCCEYVLDWQLIYRTEAEMREMASLVGPKHERFLESAAHPAFHFLRIVKAD